ncbi:MAG TPA: hypothetical protein VLL03_05030 [Burkholderiales bacterium]|nr:hypothetical protein [Burkholderiales bacterium]
MKAFKFFSAIFGAILTFGCGQGEQKDTAAKAENPSRQKVKDPEKLPGQRLQQAGQAMNKAADVEKELAKKAEETERKIEQESK